MFFLVFSDDMTCSLIKLAKKGDASAFSGLVADIEPFVYNMALRMMNGNHHDAEDMAQEAFLRVYKGLSSYKGNSSFKTWALRICKNVCLDELRRRKSPSRDTTQIPEVLPSRDTVDGEILARERRQVLLQAINSLEERPRLLIVLRDINGLSYKEIGEIMDMEQGTVKSAINRARKKLREALEEQNLL